MSDYEVDVTIQDGDLSESALGGLTNNPEREEWFRDLGLGLFIHWSLDTPLGSVISHWMCGADNSIRENFVENFPALFNPRKFDADDWARTAKLNGFRYMVFTTKHHAGFCMYDTGTTSFNVMNTAFGRDIHKELVESFRKMDIATGIYFSPFDFKWLIDNGKELHFATPEVLPENNPGLMTYNQTQLRELLTNYGKTDFVFFDGPPVGLKNLVWQADPQTLVTRGEMKTPEQELPNEPIEGVWEANYTLGTQWNYKATNEVYKSGTEIIELLIATRARGGNLLLNITSDPHGFIPFEQERLLGELGLFLFFNGEAIYDVRPWVVTNDGPIYYTKAKESQTVYAFLTGEPWEYAQRKEVTLRSIRATENTEVSMVGQNGKVLEHSPHADIETRGVQKNDGLHISTVRAYRPYNNRKWPNPAVLRITNAAPI
ncbi:MAG: alpha-L-fucosidase [Verrucomicrobiota bacterium]